MIAAQQQAGTYQVRREMADSDRRLRQLTQTADISVSRREMAVSDS